MAVDLDLGQGVGLCRVEVGQRAELVLRDALVSEANELDNDCEQSTALPLRIAAAACGVLMLEECVRRNQGLCQVCRLSTANALYLVRMPCFHLLCIRI